MNLIEKAPENGLLYVVLVDGVLFEKYTSNEKMEYQQKYENNPKLLELHMFDSEIEYRFMKTRGRGDIETVISDELEDSDDVFEEDIYIAKDYVDKADDEKVGVVNYIRYDEDDLLHISNYRLKIVKRGEIK